MEKKKLLAELVRLFLSKKKHAGKINKDNSVASFGFWARRKPETA